MVGNMIRLSTDEGDIVLDPFSGSGSVLVQAAYMNRKYVGFELNPEYVAMFNNYLINTLENGRKNFNTINSDTSQQNKFEELIIKLRCLKYARVIFQKISKIFEKNPINYIIVKDIHLSEEKFKLKKVHYLLTLNKDANVKELENQISNIISIPPLSKFGIEPNLEFKNHTSNTETNQQLYGYTATNTHHTIGIVKIDDIPANVKILSDIKVEIIEENYV
jgi:hypothetical protein